MEFERDAVMGKDATLQMLEKLKAQAESGELICVALRLFKPDGTYEDVAIGGTEQERAEALAKMRSQTN